MKEKELKDFLEKNMKKQYDDYNYYPEEVQQMLLNVYACCYRFNLYTVQTVFMLEQALKPFKKDIIRLF